MPKLPTLGNLKRKARRDGWADRIRTEADERAVLAGHRFDVARMDRARLFGEKFLRFFEGPSAGLPFVWQDWQNWDLLGPLFGWVRWSDDYKKWIRRFDRVYCEVPKKNGKSPTGAYVGLYSLCGDQEPGAKVFSVATTRDQAKIVHTHAVNMADNSPRLMDFLRINRTTATISHPDSNSVYQALASVAKANEGLNSNCIICDEVHAWNGRKLWAALKWAFASRAEPILFAITTAGEETESICFEQHRYAKAVQSGDILDLGFLGLIYATEDGDDETDPKVWKKANPSLGVTMTETKFRQELDEARVLPSTWNEFRRYRFNRWLSGESAWLQPTNWDACGIQYTPDDLGGWTCWGGLDLATVSDLSSLALVFPDTTEDEADPFFWSLVWHWLPAATAERYRRHLSIDEWIERGWLELTPGDVTDYQFIRRKIVEVSKQFDLMEIAFDPYQAEQLTQQIENEDGIPRAAFPQTVVHYAEPTAELERRIVGGRFAHNQNGLLSWQSRHCQVRTDANQNKRPVKPKPGSLQKIDGMVALIMAFSRAFKTNQGQQWPDADAYEIERF